MSDRIVHLDSRRDDQHVRPAAQAHATPPETAARIRAKIERYRERKAARDAERRR
jgi:hypothetical protein